MKPAPQIKCPTCKKVGAWFDTEHGPFCSRRCKLVDLGKWLNGENKISEPMKPEHFNGYDEMPSGEHLDEPEEP